MPPNNRWRVQGVDRKTRRLARQAAARSGVSVGEWIDKSILTHGGVTPRVPTAPLVPAEFVRSARIGETPKETPDPVPTDDAEQDAALARQPDQDAEDTSSAKVPPETLTEPETQAEPDPPADEKAEAQTEAEPDPDPELETTPEPGHDAEPVAEVDTPEPEPEPDLAPLSVDPSDRPSPPVPVEPEIAAAASQASRRLDPRLMGGVLVVALIAGGYWLLSDSGPDLTPPATGPSQIAQGEPPKAATPTPAEEPSLTNDLETAASTRPATPLERMTAAANKGDPRAQHDLAIMYLRGNGVPIDHAQAASWLRKSADGGIPKAQFNLGLLYEKGLGVQQNYSTAFTWYQRAARQGHTRAQHNLGTLFAVGKGTKQNYAKAARWFTRASKEGLAEAHYSLGLLYEKGLGIKADAQKAASFYRSALAAGSAQAAEKLTRLEPALRELPPRMETTVATSTPPEKKNAKAVTAKSRTLTPAGIINMQRLLAKLDLSPGPADGVLGQKTVEAIRLYQRFAGLPVDGKPTPDLLKDLRQVVGAMAPGSVN